LPKPPQNSSCTWDGLGAVAKTKVRTGIPQKLGTTPSGQITTALDVAMHLRAVFSTGAWCGRRQR